MNPNRPDHEFKSTSGGWGCQEELFAARLLKYGIQDLVGNIKQVSGEVAGLPGYSAWLTACLYGVPVHSYVRALTPTSLHFPPPPGYTGIAFVTAFACSEWNAWNHAVLRCVQHDGLRLAAFTLMEHAPIPPYSKVLILRSTPSPAPPKQWSIHDPLYTSSFLRCLELGRSRNTRPLLFAMSSCWDGNLETGLSCSLRIPAEKTPAVCQDSKGAG